MPGLPVRDGAVVSSDAPFVPISAVRVGEAEEALVLEVLRSGHLVQGPMVERFEAAFTAVSSTRHAIAVNNGTTALVAALEGLGVGPGDEVVTSPFTFVATLNAILETGATARFADVDGADFTLAPEAAAALVGPTTRVVMPVHLYGQAADMPAIAALAERAGLAIVEDAAQAHGAEVAGRRAGSFGVGCFSLYGTKNVTTGEGGVVTTDDDAVADRIRLLRNQGMRARYQYEVPGHNWRLTDLQAAIGVAQLERLDAISAARRANADRLDDGLRDVPGLTVPHRAPDRTHVFHQYTVRVGAGAPVDRDGLAERLTAAGVGSGVYYPRLVHDYDCYRGHPRVVVDPTPVAEQVSREVLSLPVHPGLSASDLDRVIEAVRAALEA